MALFDRASLVQIPSGYKEGKLYNIKPFDQPFEFERGSAATRVNEDGLIEDISNDTPRIDYTNGKALLLEPQRTNLVTHSENFNTYLTNPIDAIMTANYGIAPDGTTTSTKFQWLDSTAFSYRAYNISTEHVASVYVKGTSGETVMFGFGGNVTTGNVYTFNGDWQRITFTGSSATQIFFSNYGGSTATTFEAWGLQLEEASYATSYIPTNGQTETRLADVCQGGGDESTFNDSEGVLFLDVENVNANSTISISDDSSSNFIQIYLGYTSSNPIRYRASSGGASQFDTSFIYSLDVSQPFKIAYRYSANNFSIWINGVKANEVLSGSTPIGLSVIEFYNIFGAGNKFDGNVKALAYFPEALTDSELQTLTTI